PLRSLLHTKKFGLESLVCATSGSAHSLQLGSAAAHPHRLAPWPDGELLGIRCQSGRAATDDSVSGSRRTGYVVPRPRPMTLRTIAPCEAETSSRNASERPSGDQLGRSTPPSYGVPPVPEKPSRDVPVVASTMSMLASEIGDPPGPAHVVTRWTANRDPS